MSQDISGGLAFLSDVHSNPEAFEAVMEDLKRFSISRVYFLGDLFGYGAGPVECLDLMDELKARYPTIPQIGNHDKGVDEDEPKLVDFNFQAKDSLLWNRKKLGMDADPDAPREPLESARNRLRKYMDGLRYMEKGEYNGRHFLAVHGNPIDPSTFSYVQRSYNAFEVIWKMGKLDEEDGVEYSACFVGHTHKPRAWNRTKGGVGALKGEEVTFKEGEKYVINTGSVGQPRDKDPRACWVYMDNEGAFFQRVEYDIEAARKRILQSGMPEKVAELLADRIRVGL